MSQKKACKEQGIQPSQYRCWKKNEEAMKVGNPKATTLHAGPDSCIADIEEDLLEWFWSIRETRMMVSHKMIEIEASRRCSNFRRKTEWGRIKTIECFAKKSDFVVRATTRKSQQAPHIAQNEALEYVESLRPRVAGRNQDYIINMDQTPIWFSLEPSRTLDKKGARTVHSRKSTGDTRRVTCMATITASG
eukprot:scaffold4929_cov176-Amphora_coffeaeformis.AAC.20